MLLGNAVISGAGGQNSGTEGQPPTPHTLCFPAPGDRRSLLPYSGGGTGNLPLTF